MRAAWIEFKALGLTHTRTVYFWLCNSEAARSLAARLHDSLVDDPVLLLAVVDTLYKALVGVGGKLMQWCSLH